MAAIVSSTKPASLSVSVWMATWTSYSSATRRLQSIAAGVVPQSSWSLRPQAPATICSTQRAGPAAVALAEQAPVDRQRLGRLEHAAMFQGPGVQVVAFVPSAGPVPPPISVVMPLRERLPDLLRADHVDVACRCRRASRSGARRRSPRCRARSPGRGATPSIVSGLPALPMPAIRPSLTPMSALTMPSIGSMTIDVGDDEVERAAGAGRAGHLAHAVADALAAAEDDLVARREQVALDLARPGRYRPAGTRSPAVGP